MIELQIKTQQSGISLDFSCGPPGEMVSRPARGQSVREFTAAVCVGPHDVMFVLC